MCAISAFFIVGCAPANQTSNLLTKPFIHADTKNQVTVADWGIIDLVRDTPTQLRLDGKDYILTATPALRREIFLVIENEVISSDGNTKRVTIAEMTVPPDKDYSCFISGKPVHLKVRFKPLDEPPKISF